MTSFLQAVMKETALDGLLIIGLGPSVIGVKIAAICPSSRSNKTRVCGDATAAEVTTWSMLNKLWETTMMHQTSLIQLRDVQIPYAA